MGPLTGGAVVGCGLGWSFLKPFACTPLVLVSAGAAFVAGAAFAAGWGD